MAHEPILVVDDNPINLKLIKVVLSLEGYEVRTAVDADDVFLVLSSFQPRLILMDVQLPGMDGLELTKKIKNDPKFATTIIVAVTAYAMKGDEEKALAAGCDGYISKPINTGLLPTIVATYLQNNKSG